MGEEALEQAITYDQKKFQARRKGGVGPRDMAERMWPSEALPASVSNTLAKFHQGHPKLKFLPELVLNEVVLRKGEIAIFTQRPELSYIPEPVGSLSPCSDVAILTHHPLFQYFKELSVQVLALHTGLKGAGGRGARS